MIHVLRKSRQIVLIAIDRLSDYFALIGIEARLQGHSIVLHLLGYLVAATFAVFTLLFLGFALLISFWDSEWRLLAAWMVVALYGCAAVAGITIAKHYAGHGAGLRSLREEIRRDAAMLRENL